MNEEMALLEAQAKEVFYVLFEEDETQIKNINSIKLFIRQLGFDEVYDSSLKSCTKFYSGYACFKYFCGICHRKIKEKKAEA